MSFGVGMVKGREDEWSEPADIKTKVGTDAAPDRGGWTRDGPQGCCNREEIQPWRHRGS